MTRVDPRLILVYSFFRGVGEYAASPSLLKSQISSRRPTPWSKTEETVLNGVRHVAQIPYQRLHFTAGRAIVGVVNWVSLCPALHVPSRAWAPVREQASKTTTPAPRKQQHVVD
ncbi:MAG TPA: hypothetical protein VND89_11780 [Acidimicrobiales bacterium]|nr:hypothetical protein [Acidimicrobiales bacterium]